MEVILLERVAKLGHMGDTVRVKDGFARNFLLPRGKALRATENNKKKFESQRADLEVRNQHLKADAAEKSTKLDGQTYVIIRQAGETGQLYGSVSARDIAEIMSAAAGFSSPSQSGLAAAADQGARLAQDPGAPASRGRGERDDQRRALARAGRAPVQGRGPFGARADVDGRSRPRGRQGPGRGRPRREPRTGVSAPCPARAADVGFARDPRIGVALGATPSFGRRGSRLFPGFVDFQGFAARIIFLPAFFGVEDRWPARPRDRSHPSPQRPDDCAGREFLAGPASVHIGREFGADEHYGAERSTDLIFRKHKSNKFLKSEA